MLSIDPDPSEKFPWLILEMDIVYIVYRIS